MSVRDLTPAERRERGTALCRQLAEDVARIVPRGLGSWGDAWDIVAPADAQFLAALTAWEADPGPTTVDTTRTAYRAVLDGWRLVARRFEAQRQDMR